MLPPVATAARLGPESEGLESTWSAWVSCTYRRRGAASRGGDDDTVTARGGASLCLRRSGGRADPSLPALPLSALPPSRVSAAGPLFSILRIHWRSRHGVPGTSSPDSPPEAVSHGMGHPFALASIVGSFPQ